MEKKLIQSDIIKTHRKELSVKTERIVTGVYLVSSLINDKEPLKWQLREKALETLSVSQKGVENDLLFLCEDLVGLVSLGHRSALISPMNAELLDSGIRSLLASVSKTAITDKKLLEIPQKKEMTTVTEREVSLVKDINKGQNNNDFYKRQIQKKKSSSRKDKRREAVLEALSKKPESSIKDIARQVRGCSEKTIQRELNALITEGVIKKKGERRWSVYLLA